MIFTIINGTLLFILFLCASFRSSSCFFFAAEHTENGTYQHRQLTEQKKKINSKLPVKASSHEKCARKPTKYTLVCVCVCVRASEDSCISITKKQFSNFTHNVFKNDTEEML